ncbi:phage Gp37/Gp68 family protein [Pseudotabrizicola sediminis]|nr:phage Gp37/Gp68 family protein [Pseudotabrizicola sediminis]
MAEKSKIEWTDAIWNITTGCTVVDDGRLLEGSTRERLPGKSHA